MLVRVDPLRPDREVLRRAAEVLRSGGIVAFPTETVYGLGCLAYSEEGCRRVFMAKGRPADNPLIVHVDGLEMAGEVAVLDGRAEEVLRRVWPGPVTVVLRGRGRLPGVVTAGLGTVAVRAPAHPVALGLIEALGAPVAAPSANRAGRPSPTEAAHVLADLGGSVDLVLDGGPTFFGVESTIVDLTRDPPVLLRPGPFTVEELARVLGRVEVPPVARGLTEAETALAPGMKYRHYAPDTPLVLVHFDLGEAVARLRARGLRVAALCIAGRCAEADAVLELGGDLYEAARNLYGVLRRLDSLGVDVGVAPAVEERGIGLALMNRLRKAAGHREAFSPEEL